MTQIDKILNIRKKQRLKIANLSDFKEALEQEGYEKIKLEEDKFKEDIIELFKIDDSTSEMVYKSLENSEITYRADNVINFIEYIENIKKFREEHNKLSKEINKINILNIERVEYERIVTTQDDVSHIINDIENTKKSVSKRITPKELYRLEEIEKQLSEDYVYSKDIELLKKMIFKGVKVEEYNENTKTKTISIEIPNDINTEYIPAQLGSIEYHHHIKNNIPRMKRLRKNIKKYIVINNIKEQFFSINQSETLQDTINIAVAVYDNKEFKAISGSNEVDGFCKSPKPKDAIFKSSKVNKLGKLGIGYNRVNDSEKKILEEIHRQIEDGKIKSHGNLALYSKWEPCQSCYYVISQFCKKYPQINVEVKYSKEYGE